MDRTDPIAVRLASETDLDARAVARWVTDPAKSRRATRTALEAAVKRLGIKLPKNGKAKP